MLGEDSTEVEIPIMEDEEIVKSGPEDKTVLTK
jgi:hypothetical protein